ncbi:MAG: response regulator [Candidatus Thermoplasmatota archaeon]
MVNILVVDDEDRMRKLIKNILSRRYEIAGEAENGEEAVEKFEDLDPDVITLDILMPEKDGIEVLSDIKDKDPSKKVVLITVVSPDEDIPEEAKNKADAYLVKPAKKKQLLDALENVLENDHPE